MNSFNSFFIIVYASTRITSYNVCYTKLLRIGGIVVGEESCTGTRQFENYVEGNTIEALSERYFKIPCACIYNNEERIKRIQELVKEQNADGVIYYTLQNRNNFV